MEIAGYAPLITIVALIVDVFLILFTILNFKNKSKTSIYFLLTLIGIVIWHIFELIIRLGASKELSLVLRKLIIFDVSLFVLFFLLFCHEFVKASMPNKLKISLVFASLIIGLITLLTDLVIKGVKQTPWGYYDEQNFLFYLYAVFVGFCLLFGIYKLFKSYLSTTDASLKHKLGLIQMGAAFPIIFGFPTDVLFPVWDISFIPLGSFFTSVMAIFVAYAIFIYDME